MVDIGVFKVSTTKPANGAVVDASTIIQIEFNTDVDVKTIAKGITVLLHQDSSPVKGNLSYDNNRVVTFAPAIPLQIGKRYDVVVSDSIKNIMSMQCKPYSFSFTTATQVMYPAPELVEPKDTSMVKVTPEFIWNASFLTVDRQDVYADGYEICVSESDSFSTITWSTEVNVPVDSVEKVISVTPDSMLRDNQLYYWRVRPFKMTTEAQPSRKYGPWTEVYRFSIGKDTTSIVATEDEPYIDPAYDEVVPPIPEVIELFPENDFSNVGTNIKTLYARISGIIDPLTLDPRTWFFAGTHVTEDSNLITYDPASPDAAVSTALNKVNHGEMKGSWSVVIDEAREETLIIFQPVAI